MKRGLVAAIMLGLFAGALGVGPGLAAAADPAAGVDISATEGVSFTKRVTDIDSCGSFSGATIDWGDGTSSAGQFDTGNPPGVEGTHTYARFGTYDGTVTRSTDCTPSAQAPFTATVADAPLSAEGRDIGATVGQPTTAVVSHFTDANTDDPPSDFTAQISWGDGSPASAGTVSAASGGGFDVTGTHTYGGSPGQAAVNVTINSVGGSSATSSSTARIVSEPLVASFSYSPPFPCQGGPLSFDASASGPGVTDYAWRFLDTGTGRVSTLDTFSNPKIIDGYKYGMAIQGSGDWSTLGAEVEVLRPPVVATLTVTDQLGRIASSTQTINFADPDVLAVIKRYWFGWSVLGAWIYYAQPVNPTPCWHKLAFRRPLALGQIPRRPATLSLSRTMVTVRVTCPGTEQCGGTLAVRRFGKLSHAPTTAAGKTRHRLPTLGERGILIPAGGSLDEKIRLNKRGRRLAKRHWKRVTLVSIADKHLPRRRTVALRRSQPADATLANKESKVNK